jgi:hypothetical protein
MRKYTYTIDMVMTIEVTIEKYYQVFSYSGFNNNNNNSIFYYLCAESTASGPITDTDTTQCRYK